MDYLQTIESEVTAVHDRLFRENPFWIAAREGKLTINHIRGMLKESYHRSTPIVQNIPMLILMAPDYETKIKAARNLAEELPHPRMHFGMAKFVDITPEEIMNHNPMPETKALAAWRVSLFYIASFVENRTASWLTEGFNQKYSTVMMKTLKEDFGLNEDQQGLFPVHAIADKDHVEEAKDDLRKWVKTEEEMNKCVKIARDGGEFMDLNYSAQFTKYS